MKTWKLVSGILSIVLFAVVTFQSCAMGIVNTLEENGESGGSGGIILAILMLAGGIVSIATRKSEGKGGNIALIVLFGLASFFGFVLAGSFVDLNIWAAWCLINAVLAIVSMIKENKTKEKNCNEQEKTRKKKPISVSLLISKCLGILCLVLATGAIILFAIDFKDGDSDVKSEKEESEESDSPSKQTEEEIYKKLKEIRNWYVGDIWNNFVDFSRYKRHGTDSTGSEIDIDFAYKAFKKKYELMEEYDSYITSLNDDYSEIKETWQKMKKQIKLISEDLEKNGIMNDGSSLELDYLKQYGSYFEDLIEEKEPQK